VEAQARFFDPRSLEGALSPLASLLRADLSALRVVYRAGQGGVIFFPDG
jgi:hypothetical protein